MVTLTVVTTTRVSSIILTSTMWYRPWWRLPWLRQPFWRWPGWRRLWWRWSYWRRLWSRSPWCFEQNMNATGQKYNKQMQMRKGLKPICQIYLHYAKFDLSSSEYLLNRMGKEHWTSNKSIMWSMSGKSIMQPPTNPSLMCVTNNQLWLFRLSFIVCLFFFRKEKGKR